MSLYMMCRETAEGAYCDLWWSRQQMARGHGPIVMQETYRGRVLNTGEYNGYDDSDFYAVVWDDDASEPKRVIYATTRGWSYPNGAAIDADAETIAKYESWQRAQIERHKRLEAKRELEDAADLGLDVEAFRRLRRACSGWQFDVAATLLRTLANNRFRSAFRRKLAEQIKAWCESDEPAYATPLSRRQWDCLGGVS